MSGRRSAPSLPNEATSMSTSKRKRNDELLLVFPCHYSGGSNQRIGRWRWTDHLLLAYARRNTSGCRCHKRGRSVLCLSHGCMAHSGPVGRRPRSQMVMAASDSKCARRFDRSCVAQPDRQSQLYSVSAWLVLVATVIIVLRPILVRRDESGSVHPDITVARCGL